jgi:hypothetical protein
MKFLRVFLIILILPSICFAAGGSGLGGVGMGGGGSAGEAGFCSAGCTGDLVFCWGISADLDTGEDITTSDGCSAGDTTVTFDSGTVVDPNPSGSGYALYFPTTSDNALFEVTTDDIYNDDSGTFQADIYVTTWGDGTSILRVYGQANTDAIRLTMTGTGDLRIRFEGNDSAVTDISTTAANVQLNTWTTITGKWRTGASDPSLSISANESTTTSDTDLSSWTVAPATLYLGRLDTTSGVFYMKNIKIWKAYQ